jgi:hypothetical protein
MKPLLGGDSRHVLGQLRNFLEVERSQPRHPSCVAVVLDSRLQDSLEGITPIRAMVGSNASPNA